MPASPFIEERLCPSAIKSDMFDEGFKNLDEILEEF